MKVVAEWVPLLWTSAACDYRSRPHAAGVYPWLCTDAFVEIWPASRTHHPHYTPAF